MGEARKDRSEHRVEAYPSATHRQAATFSTHHRQPCCIRSDEEVEGDSEEGGRDNADDNPVDGIKSSRPCPTSTFCNEAFELLIERKSLITPLKSLPQVHILRQAVQEKDAGFSN